MPVHIASTASVALSCRTAIQPVLWSRCSACNNRKHQAMIYIGVAICIYQKSVLRVGEISNASNCAGCSLFSKLLDLAFVFHENRDWNTCVCLLRVTKQVARGGTLQSQA